MTTSQPTPLSLAPVGGEAERIAATLNEPNAWLIQQVITVLSLPRAEELVQETLALEAQGGLRTDDQKQRRTPGGVFFKLVKTHATPAERQAIFPHIAQRQQKKQQEQHSPAVNPLTWEEVQTAVPLLLQTKLGAATVKLTLVGRPLQVKELPSYVAFALQGKEPPTLPKGLPSPPAGSALRFVVFVAHKQWIGVQALLDQNPDDKLMIQGYPVFDAKSGATVVLAQQVQSVEQEKAKKATSKAP